MKYLCYLAFVAISMFACKNPPPSGGGGAAKPSTTYYSPSSNYYSPSANYYQPSFPYAPSAFYPSAYYPSTYYPGFPSPGGYGMRITYVANIAPIIQMQCVSCHNSSMMNGNVNLQMYIPDQNLWSRVVYSVQSGRMPKTGPMQPDMVQAFMLWQQAGFPYQ